MTIVSQARPNPELFRVRQSTSANWWVRGGGGLGGGEGEVACFPAGFPLSGECTSSFTFLQLFIFHFC